MKKKYVYNNLTGKLRLVHPMEEKHPYILLNEGLEKARKNYIKEFGKDKLYYILYPRKLYPNA